MSRGSPPVVVIPRHRPAAGQSYRPFIREFILDTGLLPALEQFRKLAKERRLTLAAYVSLPRVTEVANAIRRCLCPNQLAHCRES